MLILYKNESSDNTLNKTLTNRLEIPITIKRGIDIVKPELILKKIVGYDITKYNYCEIPILERFYFIDSIESINSELYTLRCTCDVLSTYKLDVLRCKARLKRSIKTGDYVDISLDADVRKDNKTYSSSVKLSKDKTIILTTVGV